MSVTEYGGDATSLGSPASPVDRNRANLGYGPNAVGSYAHVGYRNSSKEIQAQNAALEAQR